MIVLAATLVWAIAAYDTPLGWYGQTFLPVARYGCVGGTYTLHEPNEPPVRYRANFTFTGIGALSYGANIHFVAEVYDVNVSQFTDHFIGILFANSVLPFTGPPDSSATNTLFALFQPQGNGAWEAIGDMGFVAPLNFTGPVLIPQWTTNGTFAPSEFVYPVSSQVMKYNFVLPLQSQDVTNNLVSQLTTFRFELTLASLGLPAVFGLIVAVFRNERE